MLADSPMSKPLSTLLKLPQLLVLRHLPENVDKVRLARFRESVGIAKQLADLKSALKASTGSDVAVNAKVDPAILGGLIVKVGSRMVDTSLRTKLNAMKHAMKEAR